MKKTLVITILFFILVFPKTSYAVTVSGQSGVYKVTLTNVQVYDGASWTTIATPNQEMDIASGSVGAIIGTVVSSLAIDAGTYTGFATTVSATITVEGFVDSGGTRYYTIATGTNSIAAASWDWDSLPADYDENALTVTGKTSITMEVTGQSMVINPGSDISFSFSFNTTSTLGLDGTDVELSAAPGIAFTAIIDGTTYGPYTMSEQ